jgi:MFS family permease
MLGTTLPTPLYVIYQAQWHFSSGITTVIFASYAVGVLAALLLAGRSSDQAGRRPVLFAALAFSAVSTVVFIFSPGVGWLFVGRVLSGISAGLVTGTATAAFTDTYSGSSPRYASMVATAANMGGLGLGPLIAGLFAQFATRVACGRLPCEQEPPQVGLLDPLCGLPARSRSLSARPRCSQNPGGWAG